MAAVPRFAQIGKAARGGRNVGVGTYCAAMGLDRLGDGVAAALDSEGLRRLQAGLKLLAKLQAAYEAPETKEERGRAARAALHLSDPAEGGPGDVLGLVFGMLDGSLLSSPLFDVSAVAAGLDAESARCVLFAAAAQLASGTAGYFSFAELITGELGDRDLGMTAGDVRLLAAVSAPSDGAPDIGIAVVAQKPFDLVLEHMGRLIAVGGPGAAELAEAVAAQAASWKVKSINRYWHMVEFEPRLADLRDRLLALAGYPPPPRFEGPVGLSDGWGLAAARWLGPVEDWPAGAAELLAHCLQPSASRPSGRWQQACRRRLDAVADPGALLRGLLGLLATARPARFLDDGQAEDLLVDCNEPLLKGLLWAAGVLDPDWLPDVVRAAAVRCLRLSAGSRFHDTAVPGEKITYACFHALGASGSDAALVALARIGRATTSRSVHKQLEKMLAEAAQRRGLSTAALMDGLLPDHGLSAAGSAELAPGWVIALDDRARAVLTGPEGAQEPEGAAESLTDLRATVALARAQLEAMFGTLRELHVADFTENYLKHPVRAWLATRLAWEFRPLPGETGPVITGFPDPVSPVVRAPEGSVPLPPECLVRLVHPVLLDAAELQRLRSLADGLRIAQPVRQLWRETFRVSTAERESGSESARYAGHVLRFKQCYGLARSRGWAGGFLYNGYDGGQDAIAHKDYQRAGLQASWVIEEADISGPLGPGGGYDTGGPTVELCLTGEIAFSALDDMVPVPVPLADVPAEVFSETMRDVDLIVSAATVANDPAWIARYSGRRVLDAYWDRMAAGGTDSLRAARREVLASVYGTPGDRYTLTDTHLEVRGSLARYRIDLATANVRMEPSGKWLSFDSRPPQHAYRYAWQQISALDDDEILHRILVRAAILADDELLASRKLLRQIRG